MTRVTATLRSATYLLLIGHDIEPGAAMTTTLNTKLLSLVLAAAFFLPAAAAALNQAALIVA